MKHIYLLIFLGLSGVMTAQTIVTDRPDQTEASSTIPKGSLQIEAGVLVQHNGSTVKETVLPTSLFRYGLTEGFELRLQHEYASVSAGSDKLYGFNDIHVGFKAQILRKEDVNTEIAFLSHLVFASGTPEFSNGEYGTVNKLSIAHQLSPRIGLGYNIGYDYFQVGALTYSAAFGFSINDKAGVYLEAYGAYEDFEDFDHNVDGGVTYLLRPNVQADFSFGTGINVDMNYIAVGISWNIPSNGGE